MNNPLISVIIPTKNSSKTIEACLVSIKEQSYKNIELIIVDNNSTDNTKEIALKYTDKVFNKGPERSAQRNFGVDNAMGLYVVIIDSDMELSENVIKSCISKVELDQKIKGIIIPEESFGIGFWSQCKKLERSYYVGVEWMEAARFFDKDTYKKVGGYNEDMVSGEDWDLSQKVENVAKIDRIEDLIYHNEGKINLFSSIKKKYYYAGKFAKYKDNSLHKTKINKQTGIIGRYKLFFTHPVKIIKNPILWFGMIFMKTCEFGFGGVGYFVGKFKNNNK